MGTVANPAFSMLPGAVAMPPTMAPTSNPVGNQIYVPGSAPSSSGQNPLLPAATPVNAPASYNPYTAGFPSTAATPVPSFGANGPGAVPLTTPTPGPATNAAQAAASPIGGMSTMSPHDIAKMYSELKKTYGDGTAHALLNFMTSGAGFNQDAINNLFAAMQPQINRGTETLMNQFSASGNRFGSGAQIGLGDYLSQVNLNEGQIESSMYENAIQNYLSVLMPTSKQTSDLKAQSPSGLDSLMSTIQGVGAGGQAASSIISAIAPGADTTMLDAIAGAAVAL